MADIHSHRNTIDLENPDDFIMMERQRAEGLEPASFNVQKKNKKPLKLASNTDSHYILVEQAAAVSLVSELYGVHLLIWLGLATSVWGAIFVLTLSTVLQSKKDFDATTIVCIPMLMVWSLASMWNGYKTKHYGWALMLSFLPILIFVAILIWWYFPI